MKRLHAFLAGLLAFLGMALAAQALAADDTRLPYDEHADAPAAVRQALQQAGRSGKDVLLVFGANWCPDCRRLDSSVYDDGGRLGTKRFEIVKVDVGQFDRNIELARTYGNPIRKGIPAAAVLSPDGRLRYAGPLSHLLDPSRRILKWGARLAVLLAAGALLIGVALLLRRLLRRNASGRPIT